MFQYSFLAKNWHVKQAIEQLKLFQPPEGYYLAFSGGKDSIIIHRLAEMADVKFDAHYNHTTVDNPELIYFIRDNYKNVVVDYPEINMWKLIEKKMYPPTRIMRYCCDVLKEKGGMGRYVITGVRKAESANRSKRKEIENYHSNKKYRFYTNDNKQARREIENCVKKGKIIFNPIVNWSNFEVWEFIKKTEKLKYCCLYDEGYTRLGCIGCPMATPEKRKKEFLRYPKFKNLYLLSFEKMLKERKRRGKTSKWKSAEEVFEWWINPIKKKKKFVLDSQVKLEI